MIYFLIHEDTCNILDIRFASIFLSINYTLDTGQMPKPVCFKERQEAEVALR